MKEEKNYTDFDKTYGEVMSKWNSIAAKAYGGDKGQGFNPDFSSIFNGGQANTQPQQEEKSSKDDDVEEV